MAVPQLRIRHQEQESPDEMPRMRTPAGILRAKEEQLLIGYDFTRKAGTGLPVPALLFRDKPVYQLRESLCIHLFCQIDFV